MRAAAMGIAEALFALSCVAGDLEEGIKFQERVDHAKAIVAFGKAAASGNAEAQRRLGFMYYHGEGVPQDNRRAVALFEQAARAGDFQSVQNLGTMYEYGMGMDADDSRAASWRLIGAELGDASSQFAISVMYYKGLGVMQDRIEAAKWWTVAMSQGPEWVQRIRPSVESAEAKLTAEEIAEGQRRAAAWLKARETKQ